MQNLGWLVALVPWLREQRWDPSRRGRWLGRYRGYSNTNPYLAGLVLGVIVHEEARGLSAKDLADSLSRSLGSLGDALVWAGVRPALAAWSAVLALLWGTWVALVGWLAFAVVQGWLRWRCFRLGVERGPRVVDLLLHPRVHGVIAWTRGVGLAGAGALAVLTLAPMMGSMETRAFPGLLLALAAGLLAASRRWPPERAIWGTVALAWALTRLWHSVSAGT